MKLPSINQMQEYFPELPIIDIWCNPKMYYLKISTYDDARWKFDNGIISSDYWNAYQVIWRNTALRLSGVASEFDITNHIFEENDNETK